MSITYAKTENYFSSCQQETVEHGQTLTVRLHRADGTHDSETAVLAPYGDWVAGEIVSETEERLTRILTLRDNAYREAQDKINSQDK